MTEIVFKGKEYVYNHHLTLPYRALLVDQAKGIGPADLASNLVIHGDNLHALKSLLPRYAGQVDLVFIDPPYNTGNEGWCYNDNVNSPIMKEWLSTNPVDGEDMLRHDKWLCMMWPRLVLLRELLSEHGSIWITLDDNEVHHARMVLDEIFGEDNHLATVIWEKGDSPRMDAEFFSSRHDSMLCYAKDMEQMVFQRLLNGEGEPASHYDKADTDGRQYYLKPLRAMGGQGESRTARPNLFYPLIAPDGTEILPKMKDGQDGAWRWSKAKVDAQASRIEWRRTANGWSVYFRIYADTSTGSPPETIFYNTEVGSSRSAKAQIKELFHGEDAFQTPKPVELIERVLAIASEPNARILDSFAGSGTTAHAVLKANAKDGGNRKFILIEGEDYADKLTAERVRRAIKGYAWVGTQRETLLEEKINFTQFKKADQWLAKVEAIKAREGFAQESAQMQLGGWVPERFAQVKEEHAQRAGDTEQNALAPGPLEVSTNAAPTATKKKRFDKINVDLKDGVLKVEGEKRISQMVDGLGGEFTYCTLGEPLDIEKLLSGESLPAFEALGAWLFHTATGGTLLPKPKGAPPWYLGEAKDAHVWLVYEPDLMFLKSPEAALTLSRAKTFNDWGKAHPDALARGKRQLVFAPAKYLSNKQLLEHGVDYAPLPFALYREG
ncbi:MAG: site-specific DNA-methyltransferase [Betaproteobacteria bacterium]